MGELLRKLKKTGYFKPVMLMLYVPAYIAGFFIVEEIVPSDAAYWATQTSADKLIPFNAWFIIPYTFWVPFMVIAGVCLLFLDVPNFENFMYSIIISFTFCLVFYIVVPNGQDLRPDVIDGNGFCVWAVSRLYAIDTNTNVFPSIHVAGAMDGALWFSQLNRSSVKWRWAKAAMFAAAVIIVFSTLFIKQHSILDVISGLVLSLVVYAWLRIKHKNNLRVS